MCVLTVYSKRYNEELFGMASAVISIHTRITVRTIKLVKNRLFLEQEEVGHPFSLYHELGTRSKQTLLCGRKESPCVHIDMSFDLFNGGLGAAGTQFRNIGGTKHYRIKHFHDLNPLLGDKWHYGEGFIGGG